MFIAPEEFYGAPVSVPPAVCDVCFEPLPAEPPRRGKKRMRHVACRNAKKRERIRKARAAQ